jgi:hypothetical protein
MALHRVVISLQVRRLVCPAQGCPRQTFREQVSGLLERYQRRTSRLTGQLAAVVKELAGRAGARLAAVLAVAVSRSTAALTCTDGVFVTRKARSSVAAPFGTVSRAELSARREGAGYEGTP